MHTISIDFIVGMPTDWAEVTAWMLMLCDWGLPKVIVSDRDGKFQSAFWRGLWRAFGARILMTTTYHPQGNGVAECKNPSVELAIRYYYANNPGNFFLKGRPRACSSAGVVQVLDHFSELAG